MPVLCSEGVPHTFFKGAGSHLLSHTVSSAVPSAALVLTIVFGMGTGVSPERIATSSSYPVFETYKPMPDFHSLPPLWLPVLFRHYLITKQQNTSLYLFFLRKEVIQPHLPIRLPCYDFTPVTGSTFDSSLQTVGSLASGISDSHGVTGGVYKTRERIHRSILICDY